MRTLSRDEGHLLLAAIRVLSHLQEQLPTPEEVADLLQISASAVRLQLNQLQELGAVALVTSAFATHVEVRDHLAVEQLSADSGPAITEDLRAFDQRKQEEAAKMSRLFDSGEHEQQRQRRIKEMEKDLQNFQQRKKPPNPFGKE